MESGTFPEFMSLNYYVALWVMWALYFKRSPLV